MPDLATGIGELRLRNPVILASGTVGYGPEYEGLIDFSEVGGLVTKTVTREPRQGNPPPRLSETDAGLLNSIGLENVGLAAFLNEKLKYSAALPTALIVSIAGGDPDEWKALADSLGSREEVSAIEVNISCPNIERAVRPVWADPEATSDIVAAVRGATGTTVIVKLSPNVADITSIAKAAEAAGADALTVANTLTGMRIDVEKRAPTLGSVTGGLSGPAIRPVNLANVWKIRGAVSIPIIGSGGVTSARDALEYLMAGASAVEVGTAVFGNPGCAAKIAQDLSARMRQDGLETVSEYVGMARKETRKCRESIGIR